jgi:hypothetical protein
MVYFEATHKATRIFWGKKYRKFMLKVSTDKKYLAWAKSGQRLCFAPLKVHIN